MTKLVNVASVKQLSVFRYPGGKTWFIPILRRWLNSLERKPGLLIEPFGGGGIVSLSAVHEGLVPRALIVEKDSEIADVWRACLGRHALDLAERIRNLHFTRTNVLRLATTGRKSSDPLVRALAVIVLNRIRRGGVMAAGAGVLKDGENGNGLASRWYPETLAGRVETIFSMRDRIEFMEGDGIHAIAKHQRWKSAAIFVDPPYTLAAKRLYSHWQIDHEALLKLLARISGDFLATYDDTKEVLQWATNAGIQHERVHMRTTGHAIKRELVLGHELAWMNAL